MQVMKPLTAKTEPIYVVAGVAAQPPVANAAAGTATRCDTGGHVPSVDSGLASGGE